MLNIRPATCVDAPVIASLVRELADYEKLLDDAKATAEDFLREIESPNPVIHVLIAEWEGSPCGFALYFFNFSTFVGRPGLYLEDLFVRSSANTASAAHCCAHWRASPRNAAVGAWSGRCSTGTSPHCVSTSRWTRAR